MSHKFLSDARFHLLLKSIDQELADTLQQQNCPRCGKTLHHADYPRSPFGIPPCFREYYDERLSYCCGNCRKRHTPPSVRFFGRRWFPMPFLILISALQSGINDWRLSQVKRYFGVSISESTWKRWRRWWRDTFPGTGFWVQAKGHCFPSGGPLPRALISLFQGNLEQKMIPLLKFLSPITAGVFRAV
jgi:hypothetical protein